MFEMLLLLLGMIVFIVVKTQNSKKERIAEEKRLEEIRYNERKTDARIAANTRAELVAERTAYKEKMERENIELVEHYTKNPYAYPFPMKDRNPCVFDYTPHDVVKCMDEYDAAHADDYKKAGITIWNC